MPSSYQAPMRGDSAGQRSSSQTVDSNLAAQAGTVGKLIAAKGSATFSVRPEDTLGAAVQVLRDKRIGAVVVTDAEGALQGILSERDIVRKLAETPGQTLPQTVAENMTRDVVTCGLDEPLIAVLRRMTDGRFRHMPVVENGTLSGMITIGDVVNYRLTELEHEALQLKQLIVG